MTTESDTRTLKINRTTSTAHRLSHYDGACGNIHGHNLDWTVEVEVTMADTGDDNMPLDLKTISEVIDALDHVTILNADDPVRSTLGDQVEALFGTVIWFDGDPTCEAVSQWMARRIHDASPVVERVHVELAETDKYTVTASHPHE